MATQAVPTAATAAPRAAPISLCGIYEFAQLSVSVLAGFVGFLDEIGEVLGFISGFVKAFGGFFRGGSVGTKFTLHAVQSRLRIVKLDLPALSAAVVPTERLCRIGKSRTMRFDFLLLTVDFLVQNLAASG